MMRKSLKVNGNVLSFKRPGTKDHPSRWSIERRIRFLRPSAHVAPRPPTLTIRFLSEIFRATFLDLPPPMLEMVFDQQLCGIALSPGSTRRKRTVIVMLEAARSE
jgi:hypothetical protein